MIRIAALVAVLSATAALAQSNEELEKRERCAVRVAIAITGKGPDAELMASIDPQARADGLLDTTDFIERYARFINTQFNRTPGAVAEQDSAYYLAWEILQKHRPWKELFLGPYRVEKNGADTVVVSADPQGLGYFRSSAWLKRYAGNEPNGVKLSTAYRIFNNTIGLKLVPSTNTPDADVSSTGRQSVGCRGCHYDSLYALDLAASVLGKRVGTGDEMTFSPPDGTKVTLLGGATVKDDRELVTALVESEAFRFRTCRLAFNYLMGRNENRCEAPAFERCMKEFRNDGTLQAAVAAIVKDPAFCQ
ncbi:MAG: DUF1585 domain-containing protein [Archangiaceae bacterium]|nr:DUF1585 domain-containing protein [Archangiaceae bacterium]